MNFDPLTQPITGQYSIEASAGTGKTFSITLLWLRLLVEQDLNVEQILVSTFTRAATAELKERLLTSLRRAVTAAKALAEGATAEPSLELQILQQRLHAAPTSAKQIYDHLSKALSSFDLAPISTIHSFCQSLLNRHSLELGCDSQIKISQNCQEIGDEIRDDTLLPLTDFFNPDHHTLSQTAKKLESHPTAKVHLPQETLEELKEAWHQTLAQLHLDLQAFTPKGKSESLKKNITKLRLLADTSIWTKPISKSDQPSLAKEPGGSSLLANYEKAGLLKRQIETYELGHHFRSRLTARKNTLGVRSMNDLIHTVYEALHTEDALDSGTESPLARAVRSRLRAAIIDECQDSDILQIEVFKTIFGHASTTSFIVIGDPKQSIYRFRGADLASYKNLAHNVTQAPQMRANYRSDEALIDCLNALYSPGFEFPDSRNPEAKTHYVPVTAHIKEARIFDPSCNKPLVFFQTSSTSREEAQEHLAKWVAKECARLLDGNTTLVDRHSGTSRPLEAGDIAILASNRKELRSCREQLIAKGIPCQSAGAGLGSVYESDEALDVLAWLELLSALLEGGDILTKLCAFLGTPLGGKPFSEFAKFREDATQQAILCSSLQKDLADFQRSGPLPVLLRVLARKEGAAHPLSCVEGERLFTNWRQLGALLQTEFALGHRSPKTLAVWLSRKIAAPDKQTEEDSEASTAMRLETDAPTVHLTTIHGSKGLEYPVVFCPYLWSVTSRQKRRENKVALFRETTGWGIDSSSKAFESNLETALEQEDEEEHRKLYVALTRPRHRLYIGVAAIPKAKRGADHENTSKHSAFAKLPGLGLDTLELDQWEEHLKSLAWAKFYPIFEENSDSPQDSSLSSSLHEKPLHPCPSPLSYFFPFSAKRSFSSLSKSDQEHHLHAADRDHSHSSSSEETPKRIDLLQNLGKAGSILGDQLHRALENYLGNRMDLTNALAGYENPTAWETAVSAIVRTPLALGDTAQTTLEQVRERCITEMQFHLPVDRINSTSLSEALAEDDLIAKNTLHLQWADKLKSWPFSEFTGFLQGFIDLIFEHNGRWYVADYKSNRLNGYEQDALHAAMREHHYLLQSRIYTLALHRHLAHHVDNYDYEQHFGGVVYLFVRGFPQDGVWFEKPALASVERLGKLFENTPRH